MWVPWSLDRSGCGGRRPGKIRLVLACGSSRLQNKFPSAISDWLNLFERFALPKKKNVGYVTIQAIGQSSRSTATRS